MQHQIDSTRLTLTQDILGTPLHHGEPLSTKTSHCTLHRIAAPTEKRNACVAQPRGMARPAQLTSANGNTFLHHRSRTVGNYR